MPGLYIELSIYISWVGYHDLFRVQYQDVPGWIFRVNRYHEISMVAYHDFSMSGYQDVRY